MPVIREIKSKSIITPSQLPAADYVVNPYGGCTHACIYCYACFMRRFSGHQEAWGAYLDVKSNALELIKGKAGKYRGKNLFLSSVTDPYLPEEKHYRLTRSILQALLPLEPTIWIQTKSSLILRDTDILQRFPGLCAGCTLTTLDDTVRRQLEPRTASVQNRITALKTLHAAGIKTYAFIGPILPGITDWRAIVEATRAFCGKYNFENLNIRGSVHARIKQWLESEHPHLCALYREVYRPGSTYWDNEAAEIQTYCRQEGIAHEIFFNHGR